MKIVELRSSNVKRLKAVAIRPDGSPLVVVAGDNGQGKSSVLDSIAYALGGKGEICGEPIRRGTARADVQVDLGELIVRRTWSSDGETTLVVESKDGARYTHPQTRLNEILGTLSFDPLEFTRLTPQKQAETLRLLVGLDFAAIDAERGQLYAERTDVNRDVRNLAARRGSLPARHEGVPDVEASSADVVAELRAAQKVNGENAAQRRDLVEAERKLLDAVDFLQKANGVIDSTRAELRRLEERLEGEKLYAKRAGELVDEARQRANELQRAAAELQDVDVAPIEGRFAGLEETNRKVRENHEGARIGGELDAAREHAESLSQQIAQLDRKKEKAIAAANFPVEGLAFDTEGGVTFNGLPFDQASSAEQLRVSVAIGLALNPKLRVLLVRDGSLLDTDSLRMIGELAAEHDAQLWVERVEKGGATVIIEDGAVVAAAAPAPSGAEG